MIQPPTDREKWAEYEERKRQIRDEADTPEEYENAIRSLLDKLGL